MSINTRLFVPMYANHLSLSKKNLKWFQNYFSFQSMPHHNFFQHHIPSNLMASQHQNSANSHFAKSKSYNPYKNNSHGGGASTIVVNQPVRSYHFGHPTSFVKPGPSSGPIKSHVPHHTPSHDMQKGNVVHHGIRLVGLAPPSAPHLPRS